MLNILKNALDKYKRLRLDRRVVVFLFFLVVSTIFWFLSALSKEYTVDLRYPVRYTNFPDNQVLAGELPSDLELTVNAYGFTLVKYYISRQLLPIVFDVNSFSLNELPDTETNNFYVLSSVARTRITSQLGADIQILDIDPDTLVFNFTETVSRNLPVRPSIELEFRQQFLLNGEVESEPDTITVSGPASVIDTMNFVPTVLLSISNLNESVTRAVRLQDINMLEYSQDRVLVRIPVEQFTEASMKIPIENINVPDSLILKTFPTAVVVSYLVALTDYENVSAQQFRVVADYNNIKSGKGRLEVNLLKQPEFIRSLRFSPLTVDYLIER